MPSDSNFGLRSMVLIIIQLTKLGVAFATPPSLDSIALLGLVRSVAFAVTLLVLACIFDLVNQA